MSSKHLQRIRRNGIFYTPKPVAELLAGHAVHKRDISILDPACGAGALLRAAAKECKRFAGRQGPRLVGCDRFKPERLDVRVNVVHSDFFAFHPDEKFDLILTNPPYVQSGKIESDVRRKYYARYAEALDFSRNLDLWVYFLVKSTTHLRKGGSVAAVLPWSFLEAEYAQKVRKWVAENFRDIQVLVLEGAHFEETVNRVALVWMKGYGARAHRLQLGCSDKCTGSLKFRRLSLEAWNSENVMAATETRAERIFRRLDAAGFAPLERYADISIGIVTGANSYFIPSAEKAAELGFEGNSVVPVLASVEDLTQVAAMKSPEKVLIRFNRITKKKKDYISQGIDLGLDGRVHCRRREKQNGVWYDVDAGRVPDAFFTYRVSRIPYLILNPDGYRCTNALHAVFFNKLSKTAQKWIQLSLLSVFGQLSLELRARHYGNGIMKVEPNSLKKGLVYAGRRRVAKKVYEGILRHIVEGRKEEACIEATQLVVAEANMEYSIIADVVASLNAIRRRRGAVPTKESCLNR